VITIDTLDYGYPLPEDRGNEEISLTAHNEIKAHFWGTAGSDAFDAKYAYSEWDETFYWSVEEAEDFHAKFGECLRQLKLRLERQ
jgi:hypothetical protein